MAVNILKRAKQQLCDEINRCEVLNKIRVHLNGITSIMNSFANNLNS
jgi:hypothetical protein